MKQSIQVLRAQFFASLAGVLHSRDLDQLRTQFLGKKGSVQELMQKLREAAPADRPQLGQEVNGLKEEILAAFERHSALLLNREQHEQLLKEQIDVTLPGRRDRLGKQHPITAALDQMIDVLMGMGFSVQYGPDIDTDYYNFEVLNFPSHHPARDMQDTFYISSDTLLRTHTSNVQARTMEQAVPPIRIIAPGTVYRNENVSARSHVFFHQIEAMYIDRSVSFSDLLGTFDLYLNRLFGRSVKTRYRPSYFPFVEPGMEIDVECLLCGGKGCSVCKHTGWVEIAGAGMIHPQVLKNGGIDPEHYSGFAWGQGVERLVMLLSRVKDIRLFTQNDVRFLQQFVPIQAFPSHREPLLAPAS